MRLALVALSSLFLISCSSSTTESSAPADKSVTATQQPIPASPATNADAKAYLDKAAAEPGAQRTSSGLVYRVITPGTGPSPKPTDTVKVHYRGTLTNGTEFDSSYSHGGQPIRFPLNRVIPCWTEGVGMMKVGGKSQLVCPASIAYGDGGAGPIPPGATLIFEVELLGIGG